MMENNQWAGPAFKFQTQENVKKLLTSGNVYIPNMKIFADKNSFSGKIYDEEGVVEIINSYDYNFLLSGNASGLISYTGQRMVGRELTIMKNDFKAEPMHIYCFARYFFSETLLFSIEEGKNACVFITDIGEFTRIIDEKTSFARCVLVNRCRYVGRSISEHNPDFNSFSHYFFHGINYTGELDACKLPYHGQVRHMQEYLYLIKPKEYYKQYEFRSVWLREDGKDDAINVSIPELVDLCIEIKFSEIFDAIKIGAVYEKLRVDVRINYKNGKNKRVYYHNKPDSSIFPQPVFNPVARYNEKGVKQLYFFMQTPEQYVPHILLDGINIEGNVDLSAGIKIGPFDISGIDSIEYTIAQ